MVRPQQASSDEQLLSIELTSFDGGLNTETNPLRLALNESPDCLNVKISQFGRLLGRAGYLNLVTGLPARPDGAVFLFDSAGARRLGVWSNGNLYEVTFGVATLVASGVYTAGNRIARVAFSNKVYWSDGAVPLRVWDPFAGTEAGVASAGGTGRINPPAAKVLALYAGSIVAGATTVGATFEPHNLRWCVPNDPTDWLGVSAQAVAYGDGGEINAIQPLGVADTGVSPTRTIFVGKSKRGCYAYKGALGSLEESIIPVPAGVLDSDTVEFLEGPDGRGYVVFLGTDRKLWYTNGITANVLSKKIADYLADLVLEQVQTKAVTNFMGIRNTMDRQYILDIGDDRQLVYHYDFVRGENGQYEITGGWTQYEGWPSGYYIDGVDTNGVPALYFAGVDSKNFGQLNVGLKDNTEIIDHYWVTPYIHCGDLELYKFFREIYLAYATDNGHVEARAVANFGRGDEATATYDPSSTSGIAIWDEDEWDSGAVFGDIVNETFDIYHQVWYPSVAFEAYGQSLKDNLRGSNMQLRLRQSSVSGHFEILGVKVKWLPQGRKGAPQNVA